MNTLPERAPPNAGTFVAVALAVLLAWAGPLPTEVDRGSTSVPIVVSAVPIPLPITLEGVSPSAASLSWPRSLDLCFREYELAYSESSESGPWTTWAIYPDVGTTSAFVYGFAPAGSYWWRLIDRDCLGLEAASVLSVRHPNPATLGYTTIDATTVEFSWTNLAAYGGHLAFGRYDVVESADGGLSTVAAAITDVSRTAYTRYGLSPDSGYSFYVRTTDVCWDCPGDAPLASSTSNTVTFGTLPGPGGPLSVTFTYTPTAPVAGEIVYLAGSPRGGTGGYECSWTFGDANTSDRCNTSHLWRAAGTYNLSLDVSDSGGNRAVSNQSIRIGLRLSVTWEIAPASPAAREEATLTAHPSGGSGTYTCEWSFGDSTAQETDCQVSHAWERSGRYLVSVLVKDSGGHRVVVIRPIDISATNFASGTNLLMLILLAGAAGVSLHVWIHRAWFFRRIRAADADGRALRAIDEWLEREPPEDADTD